MGQKKVWLSYYKNNKVLSKFLVRFMRDGKRTKAEQIFQKIFISILCKKYDPISVIFLTLLNLRPLVETRNVRKRRRKFQVPFLVKKHRRIYLALNILFEKKKLSKNFEQELIKTVEGKSLFLMKVKTQQKAARKTSFRRHFRW